MAYNKSKHVEAAQKYLHQGKTAPAIGEYLTILKHEPKDQITLMTIGDLYVRQGETFQALEYFERLAQIFLSDGFVTKAIAIYKKIAKLAPEENRPVERLAELYVQQGILSEARPIYLQLAEMHQRAGRQPQAAALLRKLLDAEPENLRVLTQLADLSQAMGQPAEAAESYRTAAEQLFRRGDHTEAIKFADRALQIDPNSESTVTLKALALAAAGQRKDAVALLKGLPQVEAGGKAADQLLDLYLENGELDSASELANKIYARNTRHFAPAHRVAAALLEAGEPDRALALLDLVREAMTDAGEHEALSQSLQRAAERLPKQIEPREWLVELYGKTSDSFRMPDALADLAAVCEATGRHDRARQAYEQLVDRDPENEAARRKLEHVKGHLGAGSGAPAAETSRHAEAATAPQSAEAPKFVEPPLEEETQAFVTQSLTDVDLFSSYGLTQKAIDLLEVVLQRAPRHTASIERLLDLYLGSGNERGTAELASQLQQIYSQRGDEGAADRFAELRRRFERASGTTPAETAANSRVAPPEFSVPVVEAAPIPEPEPFAADGIIAGGQDLAVEPAVHEVDLSEEWAALAGILNEAALSPQESVEEIVDAPAAAEPTDEPATVLVSAPEPPPAEFAPPEPEPHEPEFAQEAASANPVESVQAESIQVAGEPPVQAMPAVPEPMAIEDLPEYSLELEPAAETNGSNTAALDADSFLSSLASELEAALPALAATEPPVEAARANSLQRGTIPETTSPQTVSAQTSSSQAPTNGASAFGASGPLSDVFDEFRAEMGDLSTEDEDLETHYNLGIAYREMGLLEEAISEFQKVAKANNQGQAFRYAMQCCTLLGLAFMEKGQPSIAAMWYERALETPGLDQESILALRYDLGVSQELAGETAAARKSFSQVYGMNIDYRDVAERLGALGKGS